MTIYDYSELSEAAKTKARLEILNDAKIIAKKHEDLKDIWDIRIEELFFLSQLETQASLNNQSGDGVNIYGYINLFDIFDFEELKLQKEFEKYSDVFTKDMIYIIKKDIYNDDLDHNIKLDKNEHFTYCNIDTSGIAYDCIAEVEEKTDSELDKKHMQVYFDLERKIIVPVIKKLCSKFEADGYEYLYDTSDDRMETISGLSSIYFLSDGSIYRK